MPATRRQRTAGKGRSGFPARAVLIDASALFRFYKCDGLTKPPSVRLIIADRVHGEFARGGPSERAALKRLAVEQHTIQIGSPEWNCFVQLRDRMGTKDIGEDASLAIALVQASKGNVLPLVIFDDGAAKKAAKLGVPTISFLETLAWLVACDVLTIDEAEALERLAAVRDGWKRPPDQAAPLASQLDALVGALQPQIERARSMIVKPKRRR